MELSTHKILAEKRGAVGWLTINNPQRRNAISLEMWQGMREALEAFGTDSDVRCVVMRGAGDKAFASGADISQFESNRANAQAAEAYGKISRDARRHIIDFDKPVIAMIRGYCLGGGLGLAMTADIRITGNDGIFGIPAARLGVAYDVVNLKNLIDLVGPSKAKEILLTGKRLSAAQALAIGLVNEVGSVNALETLVMETTELIAENAPLSMRASKRTINELVKDASERDHSLIETLSQQCFDSADYNEGRLAFMEKRKPVFSGR